MISDQYDVVVLGAGTSGCYLAERISRESDVRVLLVEAGHDSKNPVFSMPAGFTQTLYNKRYNWCLRSEPEPQLNGRSIYCPRGKVVGGSSMINGMIHSIGQIEDYESWQQSGFALASPDEMMARLDTLFVDGRDLSKSHPHALEPAFLASCEDAGLSICDPLHKAHSTHSGGVYHGTIHKGKRAAALSLLPQLRQRKNVTILSDTMVDKLHFHQGRVSSVSVLHKQKKKQRITISGELVVSLGSIGTATLLQRSGVGRPELLEPLRISMHADLPVGENLQDHLLIKKTYKLSGIDTYNSDAMGTSLVKTLWDYSAKKAGPIAACASSAGGHFSVVGDRRPDTQMFFSYGSGVNTDKAFVVDKFDAVTIGTYQMRPESRGSIQIRSDNPLSNPSIRYNYLATDTDWSLSRGGLKFQESFMESGALSPYNPTPVHAGMDADAYIRQYAETAHHPVGTCHMGDNGVVDGDLRVKGLKNLSIADASVMPTIISGNTQAVCALIGDLLGSHLLSRSCHV